MDSDDILDMIIHKIMQMGEKAKSHEGLSTGELYKLQGYNTAIHELSEFIGICLKPLNTV